MGLRLALVERPNLWNGLPAPERPKDHFDPRAMQEHWEYPGLDARIAAWKAKLGV